MKTSKDSTARKAHNDSNTGHLPQGSPLVSTVQGARIYQANAPKQPFCAKEDHGPLVSVKALTTKSSHRFSRANTCKPLPQRPNQRERPRRKGCFHFVGPASSTRPHEWTVVLLLVFLLVYVALLGFVSRFPVKFARTTFAVISVSGFVLLLVTFLLDLVVRSESLRGCSVYQRFTRQ